MVVQKHTLLTEAVPDRHTLLGLDRTVVHRARAKATSAIRSFTRGYGPATNCVLVTKQISSRVYPYVLASYRAAGLSRVIILTKWA